MKFATLVALLAAFVSMGCTDNYATRAGTARPVLDPGLTAIGGVEAWSKVQFVQAVAVVTLYDANGQAFVTRQHHTYDVRQGTMVATVNMPGGVVWGIAVDAGGRANITAVSGRPTAQEQRLANELAVLLHAVRGPLNFSQGTDHAVSAGKVTLEGRPVMRVPVTSSAAQRPAAYYFDAATDLPAFVSYGGDRPGANGQVAVYHYAIGGKGLMFPNSMKFVKIGQHVLVSQTPVMTVEFSQVRFE